MVMQRSMRKSVKIAAAAAVLLLAFGAILLVYAGMQNGLTVNADAQNQIESQNMRMFFSTDDDATSYSCGNVTFPGLMGHMRGMPQMGMGGLREFGAFLNNSTTLSTVQGSVVSVSKGMLILDTSSGQVRVLLPKEWTLNNEVVSRADLFNGTFASSGQSVTLKVLESTVFSNSNLSINVMMGYEATNATGTHAYAVLPFNIQPSS
jgi:hypothetical protein